MCGEEENFMWDLVRKGHLEDLGIDGSLHRIRCGCVDWINHLKTNGRQLSLVKDPVRTAQ